MDDSEGKKKRCANWSEKEKVVLVESVLKRDGVLFGILKGCGGDGGVRVKDKEKAWEEVTDAVNAVSSESRNILQCKKQYENAKQRAKEKIDGFRKPKTGGGPKPTTPPPSQELIINQIGDCPQTRGLTFGLDTEDENIASLVDQNTSNIESSIMSTTNICREKKTSIRKSNVSCHELEMENLELDNHRIEKEILKLDKEMLKFDKETEKLCLEIEILNMKKLLLMEQIKSNFDIVLSEQ